MGLIASLIGRSAEDSVWNRPEAWSGSGLNGIMTSLSTKAGVRVNGTTARKLAVVYAAVRAISEDLAKIPLRVMVEQNGVKTLDPEHPASRVLYAPSRDMVRMKLRESITASALLWGNGYAEIIRDGADNPRELVWIHPSRVEPERGPDGLRFKVRTGDLNLGRQIDGVIIEGRNMIHVPAHGEGEVGLSVIRYGAECMGIATAAQDVAGGFFRNGLNPSGVFVHPNNLDEKARTNLRDWLHKTYAGSAKAGKQLLLWGGMTYHQVGVPPAEAQLLEARRFQVEDIARFFRIQLHKVGELSRATFSNIEQQSIEYATDTIHPWAVRHEQEFERKLLAPGDRNHSIRYKLQALVRGDMRTRGEFYRTRFNMGSLNPDEIRILEDEKPIGTPAAQSYYLQSGMTTIDAVAEGRNLKPGQGPAEEPSQREENAQERAAAVPGMRTSLQIMTERFVTRHHRAAETASKKPNADQWADDFFAAELPRMVETFGPILAEYAEHFERTSAQSEQVLADYCQISAASASPCWSVTELTNALLEAIHG